MITYRTVQPVLENELATVVERLIREDTKRICITLHCAGGKCEYSLVVDTDGRFRPTCVYGLKWEEV